jgi:hypothetical protein
LIVQNADLDALGRRRDADKQGARNGPGRELERVAIGSQVFASRLFFFGGGAKAAPSWRCAAFLRDADRDALVWL